MKSSIRFVGVPFAAAVMAAGLLFSAGTSGAQAAKSEKGKPAKATSKSGASRKPSAPDLNQHVAANIKFLNVLSRYADALTAAKDPATAGLAAAQIEVITKDVILAGEELARLGKPSPELETKIAADKEVAAMAAKVAENTQTAVTAIAGNESVKTVLGPSIENFQSALNRIQQFAEDPQSQPAVPSSAAETTASAPSPEKNPGKK